MVSSKKTSAELLADFVYRTDYDDLPEDAIQMSRRMILDQLGDELACSALDWNKKILKYVQNLEIASGQSTILSYGVRSSAEYAAFVNATFGHGFEVDDFNPVATAHPGCVAVPAALSVGEREHLSGKDLLAGVALASEVITRVGASGMKPMLARGFHETCILGVFGASAVAGKMLGMDPERIAYGMSIAGSHASGTTEFAMTGGDVKPVHAGLGANGGIRSALLAQIGLTGPLAILEGQHGVLQSFGAHFGPDKLTERLGDHYVFLTNGFKPYCCAIDIHSPIDALTRVIKAHSLGPKDIAEIDVPVAHLIKLRSGVIVEPRDITGAQLSMHYSLALTVCKKSNNFETYLDAWRSDFKDPEVLAVARKVSIVEVPDLDGSGETPVPGDAKTPPLTVKTQDGTTYAEDLLPSKGSPQNPMTDKELEDKFMGLATRVMPEEQAAKIAATVRNLETIKDLRDLTELLVSPPANGRAARSARRSGAPARRHDRRPLLRSGARRCLHAEQAKSKEDTMALRVPKAELPTELKENMIKQVGAVPESVEVLWHNPRVTQDNLEFGRKVGAWDAADASLRTFAHMAVTAQVGCSWCLDFGYFSAQNRNQNQNLDMAKASQVPRWRESAVFTPLERDVLEYAEAMTSTPPTVTDELSGRLLDQLGPAAMVELTAVIAYANMAARANVANGVESQGFSAACQIPLAARPESAGLASTA